jgi:hypothetical protein
MAMIRKGQVAITPANDMKAQSDFIAALFGVAAKPELLSGLCLTYVRVCNGTVPTALRLDPDAGYCPTSEPPSFDPLS